jgi:hypothetical protein
MVILLLKYEFMLDRCDKQLKIDTIINIVEQRLTHTVKKAVPVCRRIAES